MYVISAINLDGTFIFRMWRGTSAITVVLELYMELFDNEFEMLFWQSRFDIYMELLDNE